MTVQFDIDFIVTGQDDRLGQCSSFLACDDGRPACRHFYRVQLGLKLFDSPGLGFILLPFLLEELLKRLESLLDAGRRNGLSRTGQQ